MKEIRAVSLMLAENRVLLADGRAFLSRAAGGVPEAAAVAREFIGSVPSEKVRLIVCVPRPLLAARFLEMPALQAAEIKRMAAYQAAGSFPFSEDELVTDAAALSQDAQRGVSALFLAAIRKSRMDPFLELFERIGRYPDAFVPSCFALQAFDKSEGVDFDHYCHVHLQDGWMELDRFADGALASSLAIPLRDQDRSGQIVSECRRSLNALRVPEKIQGWVVSGLGSGEEELRLSDALEIALKGELKSPVRMFADRSDSHPVLSGALNVPENLYFNFLPREHEEKKRTIQRRQILRSAGVWAALGVLAFAGTFGGRIASRKIEIARLDTRIKTLEPDARKADEIFRKSALLRDQTGPGGSPLEALRVLHELAPGGVTLSSLSGSENGRIVLQGTATRYPDVMELISRAERSPLFSQVELKTSGSREARGRSAVDFQIQCRLKGGEG